MTPNIDLIRALVREKGWSKSHLAMRMMFRGLKRAAFSRGTGWRQKMHGGLSRLSAACDRAFIFFKRCGT
jgi:hypothetical protein